MIHDHIKAMNNTHKNKILWNSRAFKQGYLDGLNVFSFVVTPYRPKAILVPMVGDAWRDVGAAMSGALMAHADSEKTKHKKTPKKQARAH